MLSCFQASVTTTPKMIFQLPDADCTVVLINGSSSATPVAIGTSNKVRATNGGSPNFTAGGAVIKVGGKHIYTGMKGSNYTGLWAVNTAGTSTVSVFVSINE